MSILYQSKQLISLIVTWDTASFRLHYPRIRAGAVEIMYHRSEPTGRTRAGKSSFAVESNFSPRNTLVVLARVCCLNDRMHPASCILGSHCRQRGLCVQINSWRMKRDVVQTAPSQLCPCSQRHRQHSPRAFLEIYLDTNVRLLSND